MNKYELNEKVRVRIARSNLEKSEKESLIRDLVEVSHVTRTSEQYTEDFLKSLVTRAHEVAREEGSISGFNEFVQSINRWLVAKNKTKRY